ncbi:MAG: ABC transporter permease [Treponema sp.]|nr:ABC transporter permease [Treponema sp.]
MEKSLTENGGTESGRTESGDDEEAFFSTKIAGFWTLVWRRFCRHKLALFGASVLGLLILIAVFADFITPYGYDEVNMAALIDGRPAPPFSGGHIFGTDNFGRSYLTRILHGGRISMSVGLVSMGIALLIGVPLGCLAGYFGGWVDAAIMRLVEFLSAIPVLFLILIVNGMVMNPSIYYVMVIIGIFGWMGVTRQVRGQFLSLRRQEFVQAAFSLGYRDSHVIFRHILPNALAPVIVFATMGVAGAILTESALSYLGMGVQEPIPSWGAMLRAGQGHLRTSPHMAVIPGTFIMIVVLSLNFLGDGLRDALDPRISKR